MPESGIPVQTECIQAKNSLFKDHKLRWMTMRIENDTLVLKDTKSTDSESEDDTWGDFVAGNFPEEEVTFAVYDAPVETSTNVKSNSVVFFKYLGAKTSTRQRMKASTSEQSLKQKLDFKTLKTIDERSDLLDPQCIIDACCDNKGHVYKGK